MLNICSDEFHLLLNLVFNKFQQQNAGEPLRRNALLLPYTPYHVFHFLHDEVDLRFAK